VIKLAIIQRLPLSLVTRMSLHISTKPKHLKIIFTQDEQTALTDPIYSKCYDLGIIFTIKCTRSGCTLTSMISQHYRPANIWIHFVHFLSNFDQAIRCIDSLESILCCIDSTIRYAIAS